MNFIDRAVNYFSPIAGAKRARARHATRIYEGASVGRRATSWKAQHLSQNAEMMYAIRPLRDRARDLARNTPYAARMLDIITSHVIGDGIMPISATGIDKVDTKVNDMWEEWQDQADVTGHLDFYSMQALAVRSMVESGEVVLRYIDQELNDDLRVPMQLQILESDYIDQFRDGLYGTADIAKMPLRRSRLGVGLGEFDKIMGLWLFKNHPGELNTIWQLPYISEFIPQSQLIHMFKVLRPGQVRGVPWMAPILTTARECSDFLDAVNVKARVEACFVGFITNDDTTVPLLDQTQDSTLAINDWANPNAQQTTLEPGMLKELRDGQTITFGTPSSNTQVEPVLLNNLQAMAAGVGCTYDQMSGDLRQANYSSLRAGKLDFWRLVSQTQKRIVIPKLCRTVRKRWLERAILAGELPRMNYKTDWIVPAKEYIDPKKDADADKNEVRAGRMTPQAYIAARGGDWKKNLADIKAFNDLCKEYEIILDTNPADVDQHGRQPPKGKGDGDDAKTEDQTLDDAEDDAGEGERIIRISSVR